MNCMGKIYVFKQSFIFVDDKKEKQYRKKFFYEIPGVQLKVSLKQPATLFVLS